MPAARLVIFLGTGCLFCALSTAQSPRFTSTPVENGVYNEFYEYIITAVADEDDEDDTIHLEYSLSSGSLPAGLTLQDNEDNTGRLAGTPEEAGIFAVELMVRYENDHSRRAFQTFNLDIAKAMATITLGDLEAEYTGDPQPVTVVTSPPDLSVTVTYNGSDQPPADPGQYNVEAVVDDENYSGFAQGILTISDNTQTTAEATVTIADLVKIYNGNPQTPTVTTDPAGLSVNVTYNGVAEAPVNAGSYTVVATVDEPGYEGSATATFVINKAQAAISLSALTTTYTGSPQQPVVSTDPGQLAVDLLFNGSPAAPTDAGSYTVDASINDSNYEGSTSDVFTITKAEGVITLSDMTKEYTGSPQSPTVSTSPAGLAYTITYNGSPETPVEAGQYSVIVTISDPNYSGSAAGTFTISSSVEEASVELSDLVTTYNGNPQYPTAVTTPPGLAVEYTFDGTATPPVNAGNYAVVVTITEPGYSGSDSDLFIINKADAQVILSEMSKTYTGEPQSPTITTEPAGLAYEVTYNGISDPPVEPGTYEVIVSINDVNYAGTTTGTFTISNDNSEATVFLSNLVTTYTGEPQQPIATTDPPGLAVAFTFDGSSSAPINAGQYTVVATITEAGYSGSTTDSFVIKKAEATVTLSDLSQGFTGQPLVPTVTTNPAGLDVTLLFNGLSAHPVDPGSYTVTATITDQNYEGSTTGIFTITDNKPTAAGIPDISVSEDAGDYKIDLKNYFDDVEDEDHLLTFTIEGNSLPVLFAAAQVMETGELVLDFAPNRNGVAEITVRAADTDGYYIDDLFTVTVNEVEDRPVFTTAPITGVLHGSDYLYQPIAEDPDEGDVLSYSYVSIPNWLTFNDEGNGRGRLSGTPGIDKIGSHSVTLVISDNKGNKATQAFSIKVANSNESPSFTSDPVLDINEDQLYRYYLTASDPNGNDMTLTALALPDWLTFTDYKNGSGVLEGRPSNDDVGSLTIVMRVTDNFGAYSEQRFTITVKNVNDKPGFISEPVSIASLKGPYQYQVLTDDIDENDTRTISAITIPDWLNLRDNGDGTAELTGEAPDESSGTFFRIALRVRDVAGATSDQVFNLKINSPPVITTASHSIQEDEVFPLTSLLQTTFTDKDEHTIQKVKLESLPVEGEVLSHDKAVAIGEEIILNNETAVLRFVPASNESGTINFNWWAFDGYDWSVQSANIEITIEPVNDKPVLSNVETSAVAYTQRDPGKPVTESIIINDIDNAAMQGATITILEGYVKGKDLLTYDNSGTTAINGTFDAEMGVLHLAGEDSRSNYEMALAKVLYSSKEAGETGIIEKSLMITVTDGTDESDPVFRDIRIAGALPELDIVNAFTPNNDAVNDLWGLVNLEFYSSVKVNIFNNQGQNVFSCAEKSCQWDGTFDGKQLPAGEYFYTIDLDNGKRKYHGTVTILR